MQYAVRVMRAEDISSLVKQRNVEPTDAGAIIIRRKDARVFLTRRSPDQQFWPGLWETVGGGIEAGETPMTSLLRVIRKELHVGVARFCHFRDYAFFQHITRIYIVELSAEPEPDQMHLAGWGWFAQDKIRRMEFAMDCKKRLMDYFDSPEYLESLRSLE